MPIRPLSELKHQERIRATTWGPSVLEELDPELASLAYHIVALYSMIDAAVMSFVTTCVGSGYVIGASIMSELAAQPGARGTVTEAVAKSRFRDAPEDWALVKEVLSRVRGARSKRRFFVHDCLGKVFGHPDIIVFVPVEALTRDHAAERLMKDEVEPAKQSTPGGHRLVYLPDEDFPLDLASAMDDAHFCRRSDLRSLIDEFQGTFKQVGWIERLASSDPEEAQKARGRLATLA